MKKKRMFILGILLIVFLLLFTTCSVRKNVRNKEVKEFSKSILESNKKVKDLSFYFIRPYLAGELVYDGVLEKEDFHNIIDEFNKKIDIEFMQRIGDKYWGGSRPHEFILYVYVDKKKDNKEKHTYDYRISSQYNKTYVHDENPENIDGYQTWHIHDNKDRAVIIDRDGGKGTDTWGVGLNTTNITPTGLTLICYQSDGEPTGKLITVEDEQGLAVKSNQRLKKQRYGELSDSTEKRLVKLLEPVLDPTINPIELLEPRLDPNIKPVELLEAKFSEEINSDEFKSKLEKQN